MRPDSRLPRPQTVEIQYKMRISGKGTRQLATRTSAWKGADESCVQKFGSERIMAFMPACSEWWGSNETTSTRLSACARR
jgi:hypothetical protein